MQASKLWEQAYTLLGGGYFFLALTVPFQYMELKLSILLIVATMVVAQIISGNKTLIHKSIILWLLVCVLSGCFFVLLGSVDAHPKSYLYTIMLYIIFPLFYFPLLIAYSKRSYMVNCCKLIIYSSFFILLYVTLFFLGTIGIISFHVELAGDNNAAFQDGVAVVKLGVVSTLVYLIPFLIALLLNYRLGVNKLTSKLVVLLALVAAVIAALLSGRRAILLMLFLSPVLILLFNLFLPSKKRILMIDAVTSIFLVAAILLVGVFVLQETLDFNIYGVFERLLMVLGLNGGHFGGGERSEQVSLFLFHIDKAPFFGVGHGVAAEIIRDSDKPWRYEMSYLAMLFHTGIVGTMIYASAIFWIYFKGIQVIRKGGADASFMIAMLVGLSSMLLSYSTNPYLDAFDALWVIFLPIAFINTLFLDKKEYHDTVLR